MEDMKRTLLIVALEFGRTKAALAFLKPYVDDPLNITLLKWNYPICNSHKQLTCLLLDKAKEFVAFGYDAKYKYATLVDDGKQDDYYFFDRFTMSLHNNENVTRDMVLKDTTGKQCSAVQVFTLSIQVCIDRLKKSLPLCGVIMEDEILWVLTVPAAWTDSAKQLMRESAERAGLHSKKLLFVTETEAAFTYCHNMPTTSLQGSRPGIMIKEPGTKSMVVDLGGMTADITVLQQTYNGQLKVLCRATGDECGSKSVVGRFCKMLEEIVGGNVITKVKGEDPEDWLDMLERFKRNIESFTALNTSTTVLPVPMPLIEICRELHGKDLKSAIDSSSYVNEITLSRQKFFFKSDFMIKLFTPTIESIITLLKNTVSNKSTNGLSNILMVGRFSACPLIQDAVQAAFPGKRIIVPDDPRFSVLKGAVLFGYRPDYLRSVKGDSLDDDDDDDDDDGCIGK